MELLDCLLWMLPVILLGFFFPGCLCCGPGPLLDCSLCCTVFPSTSYEVTISGIVALTDPPEPADFVCPGCPDINGTYILTRTNLSPAAACNWEYNINPDLTLQCPNVGLARHNGRNATLLRMIISFASGVMILRLDVLTFIGAGTPAPAIMTVSLGAPTGCPTGSFVDDCSTLDGTTLTVTGPGASNACPCDFTAATASVVAI